MANQPHPGADEGFSGDYDDGLDSFVRFKVREHVRINSYEENYAALATNVTYSVPNLLDEEKSWALRSRPSSPADSAYASKRNTPLQRQSYTSLNLGIKDVDLSSTAFSLAPAPSRFESHCDAQLGLLFHHDDMWLFHNDENLMMKVDWTKPEPEKTSATLDTAFYKLAETNGNLREENGAPSKIFVKHEHSGCEQLEEGTALPSDIGVCEVLYGPQMQELYQCPFEHCPGKDTIWPGVHKLQEHMKHMHEIVDEEEVYFKSGCLEEQSLAKSKTPIISSHVSKPSDGVQHDGDLDILNDQVVPHKHSLCKKENVVESQQPSLKDDETISGALDEALIEIKKEILEGLLNYTYRELYDGPEALETPRSSEQSTSSTGSLSVGDLIPSGQSQNRKDRKRLRESDRDPNDDEGESSDEEERPRKRNKSGNPLGGSPRLKCPFYQRQPEKFSRAACRGLGFADMAKLKDHIKRVHTQPLRCFRCWKDMRSNEDLEVHLNEDQVCGKVPEPSDDRIRPLMLKRLEFKRMPYVNAKSSEAKWKFLYTTLFPDDKEIPSPYDQNGWNPRLEGILASALESELTQELSSVLGPIMDRVKGRIPAIVAYCKAQLGSVSPCSDATSSSAPGLSGNESSGSNYSGSSAVPADNRETGLDVAVGGNIAFMHASATDHHASAHPQVFENFPNSNKLSHNEKLAQLPTEQYELVKSDSIQPDYGCDQGETIGMFDSVLPWNDLGFDGDFAFPSSSLQYEF